MSGKKNISGSERAASREDRLALALTLFFFAALAWLSIRKTMGLNALWFDLGTMTQSIASVLRGSPLLTTDSYTFTHYSRLGGHVEIIYFALAPFLKLYPSPFTIQTLQAAVYASGGLAFYKIGTRLQSKTTGLLGALLFWGYPVALSATLNAVHGDTLAMGFLAWALEGAVSRRWKRYSFWTFLALLSKVYVALPVFLMGAVFWLKGERKLGAATAAAAALWGIIAFLGIRSFFVGDIVRVSAEYLGLRYGGANAAVELFSPTRMMMYFITLFVILIPAFPNLFRPSLWLIPAAAILFPAMFTTFANFYCYHHYALTVPFLVMATLDSAIQKTPKKRKWNPNLGTALLAMAAIDAYFIFSVCYPISIPKHLWRSPSTERQTLLLPWIEAHISQSDRIVVSPDWSPFLAFRPYIYNTIIINKRPKSYLDFEAATPHTDACVIDASLEMDKGAFPAIEDKSMKWLLEHSSIFPLAAARDGVFIFRKQSAPPMQWIQPQMKNGEAASLEAVDMENGISLLDAQAQTRWDNGEWHLIFSYLWMKNRPGPLPRWYALTTLEGYPASRALHVGSWYLFPLPDWEFGLPIQESVPLTLPHRPGCYPIRVGWYAPEKGYFLGEDAVQQGKTLQWGYFQMEKTPGEGAIRDSCP